MTERYDWEEYEEAPRRKRRKKKSHLPLLFSEYKREELVNIFAKKGTQAEKEKAYKILFAIDPSQNTQWEKIKK